MHGMLDRAWSVARIDSLRRMIAEKYSAGQAAFELGVSRNAAIGKATRLGLHFDSATNYNRQRPKAAYGTDGRMRVKRFECAPLPALPPEPNAHRLPILKLKRNECRYPVTEDSPFLFCGHKTADGKSYCDHHHGRAYGRRVR